MADPRVVTLLPAATEIVYALGIEPAAVSHECTHPPAAAERPRATTTTVDTDAPSAAIHEQVDEPGDVYRFDRDVLREADPDVVIAQGLCDVCAVDRVAVRAVLDDLDLDAELLTIDAHSLSAVLENVRRVGAAIGRAAAAEDLVAEARARIEAVRVGAERGVAAEGRPRVLLADWMDPPMVAGHWVPGMVELAGGAYGLAAPGEHAEPRPFSAIVEFDPQVLVVSPCGFGVEETLARLDELRCREGWDQLTAVREGAVTVVDGDVMNCPSPRLVGALATLGALCHPNYVDAGTAEVEAVPVPPPA